MLTPTRYKAEIDILARFYGFKHIVSIWPEGVSWSSHLISRSCEGIKSTWAED